MIQALCLKITRAAEQQQQLCAARILTHPCHTSQHRRLNPNRGKSKPTNETTLPFNKFNFKGKVIRLANLQNFNFYFKKEEDVEDDEEEEEAKEAVT